MSDNYFKHDTAIVDEGAQIGVDTKIWHWVHVSAKAKVGNKCVLGQNVYVGNNVEIGDQVKIQNNVSVFEGVTLEDDVFCGPSMVFTNVINPRSSIERKDEFRRTIVKKGATIGANATVICGNNIGKYSLVGAGAVVSKDVPDYGMVVGVPAKRVGWVCKCGVPLKSNECESCGQKYKIEGEQCSEV